jgi:hypothetical protein
LLLLLLLLLFVLLSLCFRSANFLQAIVSDLTPALTLLTQARDALDVAVCTQQTDLVLDTLSDACNSAGEAYKRVSNIARKHAWGLAVSMHVQSR